MPEAGLGQVDPRPCPALAETLTVVRSSEANVKARACLAREGHATSVCGAQKRSGRGSAPVRAPPAL